VQEILDLEPGQGMMKLTTASYWRPSGHNIHRRPNASDKDEWGVLPNQGYEVKLEGPPLAKMLRWRAQRDIYKPNGQPNSGASAAEGLSLDPQLAKAVEYFKKKVTVHGPLSDCRDLASVSLPFAPRK
jgi:carboxyl-terminal processing protease